MSTSTAHVLAGSVELDPTQAVPAASGVQATSQRADAGSDAAANIDLGDAGKLVRMVDNADQNHVTRVLKKPLPNPGDQRDALPPEASAGNDRQAATATALPIRPGAFNGSESGGSARPQVIREGSETSYADPAAGHGFADQATPEQRNTIRELVARIRAAVENPLAWVAVVVLAIGVLAVSAAGRRSK